MPARKSPPWTAQEIAILREEYPALGIDVADLLPERSWAAIHVMANKLAIRCTKVTAAPTPKLSGARLEEAIRLREVEGWAFARIGAHFGVSESAANNAVLIALCTRKGFKPAERDAHGRLTEAGLERVRYALKKGLKGADIQLRLGVSAACVAEQRRRYNRELKERGKATLPPPGGGEAYSGVKLSRAKIAEVEGLFLEGLGTLKVSERTGASKTSCTRIRNRLIRKLKRKSETLPGCDEAGVRHITAESASFVTPEQRDLLRAALLEAVPVRRAALSLAIGLSTAYAIRDELKAELAVDGRDLPSPRLPGRVRAGTFAESYWPPQGPREIYAFRLLLRGMSFAQAKLQWRTERADEARAAAEAERAERQRPKTFEEQLALVSAGKLTLAPNLNRRRDLDVRIATEKAA